MSLGSSPTLISVGHTNQLFIDLKLLKVNEIISTHQLKLIFEFRNDLLPSDLQTLFTLNENLHKYQTRSSYNEHLCLPKNPNNHVWIVNLYVIKALSSGISW